MRISHKKYGGDMKNAKKCPLDESWSQDFCNLYKGLAQDGRLHLCQHREACSQMRVELEENQNLSTVITKAILLNKIPNALLEINITK
jgi:hypothetical protein